MPPTLCVVVRKLGFGPLLKGMLVSEYLRCSEECSVVPHAIRGWVIYLDVHCSLHGPSDIL